MNRYGFTGGSAAVSGAVMKPPYRLCEASVSCARRNFRLYMRPGTRAAPLDLVRSSHRCSSLPPPLAARQQPGDVRHGLTWSTRTDPGRDEPSGYVGVPRVLFVAGQDLNLRPSGYESPGSRPGRSASRCRSDSAFPDHRSTSLAVRCRRFHGRIDEIEFTLGM